MNDQLFQVVMTIGCSIFGMIGTLGLMWVKHVSDANKLLSRELNDLKVSIAKEYAPRSELDKILSVLDDIRKDIKHLSNNQAAIKALQGEIR